MARTDVASRIVKAPLSRVFDALIDPGALAEWLPPSGMTGRFVKIESDDRIVQAVDFTSDDSAFGQTMTMTWTVTRVDGGTRVELRADDVPPGISAADHADGMNSLLDNLAAYLARHQPVFRVD